MDENVDASLCERKRQGTGALHDASRLCKRTSVRRFWSAAVLCRFLPDASWSGGVLFALVLMSALCGCRNEMHTQAKHEPLEKSEFFDNHMSAQPLVEGTVARGELRADSVFYTGKIGTNLVDALPVPLTMELLRRGQERFNIYCSVCHGMTGEGNGMIVQRGFPLPPSFHIDRLREAPIGHFYDVITRGYGIMYSYAVRVEPADRWAIAAYMRALQLSHEATIEDVPPEQRLDLTAK